jgi:hypothetical protein
MEAPDRFPDLGKGGWVSSLLTPHPSRVGRAGGLTPHGAGGRADLTPHEVGGRVGLTPHGVGGWVGLTPVASRLRWGA